MLQIIELQQLNMTLEVIEQKDCAFFGINSWSNGVIGDDEVVAGLIHANGEAYTMMEFPPALLEKSVTLGLIMGDITENQTMTFEYAGINSEEQRAASFSTTLTRSEAALPLESYPGQKQCADIDMLGSWTSQPFVETELIVGESEAEADDNITVSISVTVQHGCRFGGYIQESNAETKKVFTGTFHNDEVVFEVVETGVAQGELDGLAVGALLDPATLSWSFSGHRIDENGESHAVTYYTVLEKDGM